MDDLRRFFDDLPFWTFVRSKLVTGNWTVEGIHLDGHYVTRTGNDLDVVLLECAADARRLPKDAQRSPRTEDMPYTLTWIGEDGAKNTKAHKSLNEAINEAVSLKSPEIKEESSGTVIRGQAIRDMHEIVTRNGMHA